MLRTAALLALLALAQPPTRPDVLRGRVTVEGGAPLPGARVIATRAPDREYRSTLTDSAGAWAIDWPDGAGDYLVHVSAPGFASAARRVTREGAGADGIIVVNVSLTRLAVVQQLAPVVTRAPRALPSRLPPNDVDVGASEAFGTRADRLAPGQAGDLAATAAALSNVVLTPGGVSVLGLAPSQNAVTLNGMAFGGGHIPRDVVTRVRVSTTSYDPAVGWFSGARTNVQLAPGGLFSSRSVRSTVDPPALQAADPVARGLGQRAAAYDLSLAGDGPLGGGFTYNAGVQATRRGADPASIASASPALLRAAGVAPDSALRLLSLLRGLGVPSSGPASAATDHVVLLGRIDHAPYDWATLQAARTTWGLTAYLDQTRRRAQGRTVTSTPSHAGDADLRATLVQGELSRYLRSGALLTARTGYGSDRATTTPYATIPGGRVRVASDLPGAVSGLATLAFGGSGATRADARRWTWESAAELQLYPPGYATHRVKLAAGARLDGFRDVAPGNALGTFTFNSLADLEAGRPATFTRTLGTPVRRGREWSAFASAGDLWRASRRLQVLYGVRVEGSAFAPTLAHNPAVEAAFGERTDRTPRAVAVLPRAGFTLDVGRQGRPPVGSVRGGAGTFRNLLDPRLVAGPSAANGLADGVTRLTCLGAGAPTADWAAFAADPAVVPDRCIDGAAGVLRDAAPDVQLLDRRLRPQRSRRANLSWSSSWRRVAYSIEGVYSDDRDQPGLTDLNFVGLPRFTLADEGRPVYVSPSSVVAATGVVSPVEGRRSAEFGRVTSATSALRGIGRQATLTVRPPRARLPNGVLLSDVVLAYTRSSRRVEQTGFAGTTFADPARREWARGDLDLRHRAVAQGVLLPFAKARGVSLVVAAQAQSGRPFTPMVAGDVNGDGLANDRAFVHDSVVAGPLATAPARVRRCLTRQLGRPAAPNSCEGPWTAALHANLLVGRGTVPLLPRRASVVVGFANVLGGVDQLLHGGDRLRGWGTAPTPDPVLYAVRGFDPAARRFRYEPNPRFGDTRAASGTQRAPFRVTVDVRLDVGAPMAQQQLDRWLVPGRTRPGVRLREGDLARRLERNVADPYAELLAQTDSLLLTAEQVTRLRRVHAAYRAHMDSTWTALARYLAGLPDRYDTGVAFRRADGVIDDAIEFSRLNVRAELPRVLTAAQLAVLGGEAARLYNTPFRIGERRFVP